MHRLGSWQIRCEIKTLHFGIRKRVPVVRKFVEYHFPLDRYFHLPQRDIKAMTHGILNSQETKSDLKILIVFQFFTIWLIAPFGLKTKHFFGLVIFMYSFFDVITNLTQIETGISWLLCSVSVP